MTSLEILRHFVEETQQRDVFTKTRIDRMFTRWRVQKEKVNKVLTDKRNRDRAVRRKSQAGISKIAALPRDHVCECGQSYGSIDGLTVHRRLKHGQG